MRVMTVLNFHGGQHVTQREAAQELIAGVIKQAVEDYQLCVQRGVISEGRVKTGQFEAALHSCKRKGDFRFASTAIRQGIGRGLTNEHQVKELCAFFGGDMDALIDVAGLEISPDAIRKKLGVQQAA